MARLEILNLRMKFLELLDKVDIFDATWIKWTCTARLLEQVLNLKRTLNQSIQ